LGAHPPASNAVLRTPNHKQTAKSLTPRGSCTRAPKGRDRTNRGMRRQARDEALKHVFPGLTPRAGLLDPFRVLSDSLDERHSIPSRLMRAHGARSDGRAFLNRNMSGLHLRDLDGMKSEQESSGPLRIELGIPGLDAKEKAVAGGQREAGHVENRMIRPRQAV